MNNKFIHKTEKTQRYTEEHLKGKKILYWIPTYKTKKQKTFSLPGWSFQGSTWNPEWPVS